MQCKYTCWPIWPVTFLTTAFSSIILNWLKLVKESLNERLDVGNVISWSDGLGTEDEDDDDDDDEVEVDDEVCNLDK